MNIQFDFINGVAVGLEYIEPFEEEGIPHSVVLDLFLIRLLFQWA